MSGIPTSAASYNDPMVGFADCRCYAPGAARACKLMIRKTNNYGTHCASLVSQSTSKPLGSPMMKAMMIVLVALFGASLSACNTVEGAGKDVKATGAAVEKAADEAKPK